MTTRNSPKQFTQLADLEKLDEAVVDKRNHKRSASKKNRRDRHYKKQFIKNVLDRSDLNDELLEDFDENHESD